MSNMKSEEQIKARYEQAKKVILDELQSYEQDLGVKVDGDVHLYREGETLVRIGFTPNFPKGDST